MKANVEAIQPPRWVVGEIGDGHGGKIKPFLLYSAITGSTIHQPCDAMHWLTGSLAPLAGSELVPRLVPTCLMCRFPASPGRCHPKAKPIPVRGPPVYGAGHCHSLISGSHEEYPGRQGR